jgi:hypothetical protein
MATFLDIGLIQHFSVIFPLLLVFVIIFALLERSKIFGENKGLHSLIALCVAIMMLFTPGVVDVVSTMAPWFVLMLLAIIFFLVILLALGTKLESIIDYASEDWGVVHWFLLVIGLIVLIGALGNVYGEALLPYSEERTGEPVNFTEEGTVEGVSTDTGDFNSNVGRVIFHPKTVGMFFLFMIAALAIRLLSVSPK